MREPVKFEIQFESPFILKANLQKDLYESGKPPYRVVGVDLRLIDLKQGRFHLTVLIHPDDMNAEQVTPGELYRFRDQLISLLAIAAMVPAQLVTQGLFTFDLGEKHYKQTSLGPGRLEGPPVILNSLQPLIKGQFLSDRRTAAVYLFWQALNSHNPLYRFINFAICVELLSSEDSTDQTSIHPRCSNPECDYELAQCPECSKSWTIPNSLRNKIVFLLKDKYFVDRFIKARNKVFHGSARFGDDEFREDLRLLNSDLLIVLHNYLGIELGLNVISKSELHWTVDDLRIFASVYFTMPSNETNF